MAIQTINLTVPGGDTPRSANTKINANFTNTNHAASRTVGTANKNLAEYSNGFGLSGGGYMGEPTLFIDSSNLTNMQTDFTGCLFFRGHAFSDIFGLGNNGWATGINIGKSGQNDAITIGFATQTSSLYVSHCRNSSYTHHKLYSDKNTTLDSNGYIKPSSPVLRVFSDHIEGNTDGDKMAATYTKNGVGDYTITGTTGLRTDGWYITVPNDINGNPHVAVTLDDTDGVITLKTYVRIFDMTTFKFVPDLDQPLDIPDGRWIDLRFNDLPAEPMPPEV